MEFRIGTVDKKTVIILAVIFTAIIGNILYCIRLENRCEEMIELRGECVMGFVRKFYKNPNVGLGATVEFKVGNDIFYANFGGIDNRFKLNSPIYVKYDPQDPECNILCQDSLVIYKGKSY